MQILELQTALPHSILLAADRFRFSPGERRGSPRVLSRRLFWCRSGRGVVTVNGERFALGAGTFVFMPWGHSVAYEADRRVPFEVGSIHLIPFHRPIGAAVFYQVPHLNEDQASSGHRDSAIPGFESGGVARAFAGSFPGSPALAHLVEYIADFFRRGPREKEARLLSHLLLLEIRAALDGGAKELPASLQTAIAAMERHEGAMKLSELSRLMNVSPSSVIRLFKRETGFPPRHFLMQARIRKARELILGTSLPIQEIGERVGLPQAHYFSRLFRKITGVSPRQCRAEGRFV
jgi:AraC-like DNA-binding protein